MRMFIVSAAIVLGTLISSTSDTSTFGVAMGVVALDARTADLQEPPPPQPPQINVEVKREGGGRAWYMSPTWMAIGAIALVLLVLIVVMASRGSGGTTVVRG